MVADANKFNIAPFSPRVLVCPLEWGLGHATRCIPIIRELIDLGAEVLIGAEGATQSLLQKEFPSLKFLPLMGYRMRYSRYRVFMPLRMLLQAPKIFYTISAETRWLKKMIREYNIHAVISDNRFGLYNSTIPSIYITHQLLIRTGNRLSENIAQRIHYHYIKKYDQCWVPDYKDESLAGQLSHPPKLPGVVKYLGALSRFTQQAVEKKYDLLVTISGPEPQRTIFEELIFKELTGYKGSALVVRGVPEGDGVKIENFDHVEIVDHLEAAALNKAMLSADIVISRSGYTTIMDLVKLGKKAILIPTPGQTEQEYLAKYLTGMGWFYCIEQKEFSLEKSLADAEFFPFKIPSVDMDQYKIVIHEFVQSL